MQTTFTDRMNRHWTQTLGLASSEALIEGWRQLEQAAIRLKSEPAHWQVLQLPTGSGKTEALKVLCSLQDPISNPGILIVTKFQDQADEIAKDINSLATGKLARSVHRKSPAEGEELGFVPVLATTHAAYRLALQERIRAGSNVKIDRLLKYLCGRRSWLFVDEAFDWVDSYDLDVADLRSMSGDLGVMRGELRGTVASLSAFLDRLTDVELNGRSDRVLSAEHFEMLVQLDLQGLQDTVATLPAGALAKWAEDQPVTETQPAGRVETPSKARYLDALNHLQSIVQIGHGWRSRRGGQTLLHSSRSLLGADGMRGIILDATADVDPTYALMKRHVELLPRPQGIRNYRNATLHVSYGHSVGKNYLTKRAAKEWPLIWGDLQKPLKGRNVLVCAHKDVLPIISGHGLPGGSVQYANWGKLDGKNDWHDCDALVLFGLPYLDDIVPTQTFIAHQGPQANDWFEGARKYEGYDDIRSALGTGYIARSDVQAVNRVRSRKSIDNHGNCAAVDLYMLLPKGKTADVVLNAIQSQMPGIRIVDWEARAAKRKARKVPTEEKFTRYFADADPGIYTKSALLNELGIHAASLERMTAKLRDCRSALAQKFTSLAVRYCSQTGRGREAYFIKH